MSSATLTIIADNSVMELIPDKGSARRLSQPGASFLAEHGFSALIEMDGQRVLFDAGVTDVVVPRNLALLGVDIATDLTAAVISHGHADHTGAAGALTCPVHVLVGALGTRTLRRPDGVEFDLTATQLLLIREHLVLHDQPVQIIPGLWASGPIPRLHEWEAPRNFFRSHDGVEVADDIPDDQALVLETERGLVVVAGCAHAGIINTIRHAQALTGQSQVYAVVGGFHLIDANAEKLERTIAALRDLDVAVLAPTHCTGFAAMAALAAAFGDRFVYLTGGHQLAV